MTNFPLRCTINSASAQTHWKLLTLDRNRIHITRVNVMGSSESINKWYQSPRYALSFTCFDARVTWRWSSWAGLSSPNDCHAGLITPKAEQNIAHHSMSNLQVKISCIVEIVPLRCSSPMRAACVSPSSQRRRQYTHRNCARENHCDLIESSTQFDRVLWSRSDKALFQAHHDTDSAPL